MMNKLNYYKKLSYQTFLDNFFPTLNILDLDQLAQQT